MGKNQTWSFFRGRAGSQAIQTGDEQAGRGKPYVQKVLAAGGFWGPIIRFQRVILLAVANGRGRVSL